MDHIGIDVHKRESQIYILAEGGEVVEQRIHTEPERFAAVLGPRPLKTGSSYVLQRSPQPPSACCTLSSQSRPLSSQDWSMSTLSARMPRNTCHVP